MKKKCLCGKNELHRLELSGHFRKTIKITNIYTNILSVCVPCCPCDSYALKLPIQNAVFN